MDLTRVLSEFGLIGLANLRQKQEELGLSASGKSAEQLFFEATPTNLKLWDGAGYWEAQANGYPPGTEVAFSDIFDWLGYQKYGLGYEDEKDRENVARSLVLKIYNYGTYAYQLGGNDLMEAIGNDYEKNLISKIELDIFTQIESVISRAWSQN